MSRGLKAVKKVPTFAPSRWTLGDVRRLAALEDPPALEMRALLTLLARYRADGVDWWEDTENVDPCAQDPRLGGARCVGCDRVIVGRESHQDHAWWCSERVE